MKIDSAVLEKLFCFLLNSLGCARSPYEGLRYKLVALIHKLSMYFRYRICGICCLFGEFIWFCIRRQKCSDGCVACIKTKCIALLKGLKTGFSYFWRIR